MVEKITLEKAKELSISSLPTRPNTPASFGGMGFSSADMKSAFDALTFYVIEKYNELIDSVSETGTGSFANYIPTGFFPGHTLSMMFTDIRDGNFSSYISLGNKSLITTIEEIQEALDKIKEKLEI